MDKITYIVGAGFSRYANLPLMNDFYFHSKDLFSKLVNDSDKKSFQKVFDYFEEFSKVKHIMGADFYNIEDLLSIIEMDSFVNGRKGIYKDYLTYLKKVIELSTPTEETQEGNYQIDKSTDTEIYSDFVKLVYGIKTFHQSSDDYYERVKNNDNGIISLNYDLLLEKALNSLNKYNIRRLGPSYISFDFSYGLEDKFISYLHTDKPRFNKLKLAKIHGSINFTRNNLPIIVPPTWNKTSNKELHGVWKFANDLLSESNQIVFIGYSLPLTDLYVKYLLICGIKNCYNLKKIIVVCPDEKDEIKNRYENFFDINFRNKAFEFIPTTFEEWLGKPKRNIKAIQF